MNMTPQEAWEVAEEQWSFRDFSGPAAWNVADHPGPMVGFFTKSPPGPIDLTATFHVIEFRREVLPDGLIAIRSPQFPGWRKVYR